MDNGPGRRLACRRWVAAAIVCAAVVSGLRGDEKPNGGKAPQAAAPDVENKQPIEAADNNAGKKAEGQAPRGGNPLQQLLNKVFGPRPAPGAGEVEPGGVPSTRDNVDLRAFSDRALIDRLSATEKLIEKEKWDDAIEALQSLLEGPEDSLWQRPDGTWRSLRNEAESRIASLPPDGLRNYRSKYSGLAKSTLESGGGAANLANCLDVARRYFHTDAGYAAADALAAAHFDRGEFAAAVLWVRRLWSARAPLTAQPQWRCRAAYACHHAGDEALALKLVEGVEWGPLAGAAHPARTVREWLAQLPAPGPQSDSVLSDWPMLYGTPARTGVSAGGEPLLLERWSRPLAYRHAVRTQVEDLLLDLSDNQRAAVPAFFPVAVDGKVAFRTLRGLQVVDASSGRLLWETPEGISAERLLSGEQPQGLRQSRVAMRRVIVQQYAGNQFDHHQLTSLLFRDATHGLLSSDGRRLFSLEQLALMSQFNNGYWWGNGDPSQQDPHGRDWSSNQIVAFDLETGRPLWETGGRETHEPFDPPLAGTFFFGPPVPADRELFVIGEKDPDIRLFALDPDTGAPLWSQTLASSSTKIEIDSLRRMWACQPAVDAAVVVCPTTAGWLVAVDRERHDLLWAHRYAPRNQGEKFASGGQNVHSLQPLNTRWAPSAPILAEGRVVFTPAEQPDESGRDQPRLVCLDALSGEKQWEQDKGDGLYLAGVFDGRVLVVGTDSLRALSLRDGGKTLWRVDIPRTSGPPSGRGAAVGERFLLPLQSGELWTAELETGKVVGRMRLARESQEGDDRAAGRTVNSSDEGWGGPLGNLVMHQGMLLSLNPFAVTGYEQRDVVKSQIAARRQQDPADLWAAVRQAEVDVLEGRHAAALGALQTAEPLPIGGEAELLERHRKVSLDCLLALVRDDLQARDDEFARAQRLAATEEELLEIRRLEAERRLARQDLEAAFDVYLGLSAAPADRMIRDGDVTIRVDCWLAGRLHDCWTAAQGETRQRLDDRIGTLLQGATEADVEQQRHLERLWEFHPAALPLRRALIERLLADREFAAAEVRLRRLTRSPDRPAAAAAWARLADALLTVEQPADAAACLVTLQRDDADVALPTGKTAGEHAADVLRERRLDPQGHTSGPVSAWSGYDFSVVRGRHDTSWQMTQDIVVRADESRFYRQHRFEFDPQWQRLMVVRAEDDREYWSIPLRASQPHVYNQAAAVFTSGLQMVVVHRGVLHALSAPDRRHLWTQPLPDRGLNAHNRPIVDEPVEALQPASGFAARVGLSRFRSPAGMLAAVTPWCVAHHGRGEIVALDPVSGDVLWRRRGIAPQTMVHGDQDVLYVAPQEAGDAIAVRAGDGRRLEREGLSGLVKAGLAVIDGAVVAAERNAVRTALGARSGTFRLRAVEPATSTQRWSQEFPDQIRLSLIGREELFVLAPDCACEVLDLARGTRTPLGRLPEELAKATQIHAVADAEHVYLTIDHPRNNAFSYVSSPAIRVNGTIVAFSRERGGLAWQQKVENQNLLLSQFAHSPLLVCTAFQSEQRRNVHVQTVRLVAIDKRTGRIVAEMNRPSAGGGFQQFALSRSERFIELRSYNERVRIQATEPHAGGGGE